MLVTARKPSDGISADSSSPTTAFLRNVPRTYSASDVARALQRFVHRESFDFVYVPWGKGLKGKANMGFCFVNFVDHASFVAAVARMDDQAWMEPEAGEKRNDCRRVQWKIAAVQGLAENLRRFDCLDHGHPPLILIRGRHVHLGEAMRMVFAEETSGGAPALAVQLHGFQAECSYGDTFFESDMESAA
mmetsp:Transcript_76293/g.149657  ORF Transcript_76293/g.149657 Transcript_76293/m.149657 type:complete len:189 (-) Transcript_76293:542-1108(-)